MKIKSIAAIIAVTSILFLGTGCTTDQIESSLPVIGAGVSIGTAAAINAAKVPASTVAEIQGIATAVYSVTGGNAIPAVGELQNAIKGYAGDYATVQIGKLIVNTYATYYPQLVKNGKVKVANDLLNTIAANVILGSGGTVPASATAIARQHPEIYAMLRKNGFAAR